MKDSPQSGYVISSVANLLSIAPAPYEEGRKLVTEIWEKHLPEEETRRRLRSFYLKYPPQIKQRVDRAQHRVDDFAPLIARPNSILDVGCGDGSIATAFAERYDIPKEKTYGLDLVPILSPAVVGLHYDAEGNIPLPDKSVSLTSLFVVLHHVSDPEKLIREVCRVTRHNVIIRDHDNNDDVEFLRFIHFLHAMWEESNKEPPEQLNMISLEEITEMFRKNGFRLKTVQKRARNNAQRIFHAVFAPDEEENLIDLFSYLGDPSGWTTH